ncbi:diacylglycerol/lipid kinase family protein [Nigerium massiliense]|uniref:diacylglycerol/lipid kinase family protein n=1 Tax=Nigerium massiliense TaxID=1522317 RepID=UPI00058C6BC5|nr:diacylglycerol kinase family protein [Nigerium massiliense]
MTDDALTPGPWAAVINPSKFDDGGDAARDLVRRTASDYGWPEPVFHETTIEDPGTGQAEQALADGAELVIAVGGDGTIRSVAEALRGSGVPMGLVPMGTGNLLARALATPLDLENAVDTVFSGGTRKIDVGHITADDRDPEVFLVMAGLGLDADIMATADDTLKAKVGWLAYVVAGAKNLFNKGFRVWADADGAQHNSQHARTVLIGNVGQIQGGVMIMPEALLDDGLIDVLFVAPRGPLGWGAVALNILTRGRRGHGELKRTQCKKVTVRARKPIEAQIDGDTIGAVRQLVCTVEQEALEVRIPPADPE